MTFDAVCRHRIIPSGGPERQAKDLDSSPQVDYRDYPITADSRRITGSGRPFTFALHRSLSLPVCSVHSSGAHTQTDRQTDMALRLQVSVARLTLCQWFYLNFSPVLDSLLQRFIVDFIVANFDCCVGSIQLLHLNLQQSITFNVVRFLGNLLGNHTGWIGKRCNVKIGNYI